MPALYTSNRAADLPPSGIPLEMTDTLHQALRHVARAASAKANYRRGRNVWFTRVDNLPDISANTVARLKQRNVVEIKHGTGKDRLVLSKIGKVVAARVARCRRKETLQ